MLCHELMKLQNLRSHPLCRCEFHPSSFSERALYLGSLTPEYRVRPECQISGIGLDFIHEGKDQSIDDMLQGGDGFPRSHYTTSLAIGAFDCGAAAERHDIRTMRAWEQSLNKALNDRKAGVRG